jgi:hypothetical protein
VLKKEINIFFLLFYLHTLFFMEVKADLLLAPYTQLKFLTQMEIK